MFLGVKTKYDSIINIVNTPMVGGIFLFLLASIPAVILSAVLQSFFPAKNADLVFAKSMLILLPSYNYFLWRKEIKIYILFIPSWILFAIVATYKAVTNDYQ